MPICISFYVKLKNLNKQRYAICPRMSQVVKLTRLLRSSGDNLVSFFSIQLCLSDNFSFLKLFKHALNGGVMLDTKVGDDLPMSFNAIGCFSEIRNEVQDVDLFHIV